MKLKYLKFLFLIFIAFYSSSCEDSYKNETYSTDTRVKSKKSSSYRYLWEEQLEFVKSNNHQILSPNDIQLLEYKEIEKVDRNNISRIKADLISEDNYIPFQENNLKKIEILKISKAKEIKSNTTTLNFGRLKETLDTLIVEGLEVVRLKWKVKNDLIFTDCIVSSEKGIIYDNLLTNIIVLGPTTIKSTKDSKNKVKSTRHTKNKRFKVSGETPPPPVVLTNSAQKSVNFHRDVYYLFGLKTRGSADINYEVIGTITETFYVNQPSETKYTITRFGNCNAYSFMELGSHGAQVIAKSLTPSLASFAYAYYLATPSTTVSMTFANGAFNISATGNTSESFAENNATIEASSMIVY